MLALVMMSSSLRNLIFVVAASDEVPFCNELLLFGNISLVEAPSIGFS